MEDFRDHLIFRRTKAGISRKRTQKGLEGLRRGTNQICLENEDMGGEGGGGIAKVNESY